MNIKLFNTLFDRFSKRIHVDGDTRSNIIGDTTLVKTCEFQFKKALEALQFYAKNGNNEHAMSNDMGRIAASALGLPWSEEEMKEQQTINFSEINDLKTFDSFCSFECKNGEEAKKAGKIFNDLSSQIDKLKLELDMAIITLVRIRDCGFFIPLPERMDAVRDWAKEVLKELRVG